MDLKITNAILPGRQGQWDVGIAGDRITHIAPTLAASATQTLDAQGNLLIPGLVDGHIHLDKALILDRYPALDGTFDEALRETLKLKQSFTIEDIQNRARRVIEQAIAFGTTAMRTHVEVDPTMGLDAMEALLPLRKAYSWGITLQLAVFAQEGITNHDGLRDQLRQALAMGGDAIGSAPYVDPDPKRNIETVFDLAQEFDCDVDFHLDFLDNDEPLLLPFVIEETVRRGWQGRVYLGHMTKLAALTPSELETLAAAMREAGVSVLALPATDLYMMARKDTHNVRRGIAPVHRLAELGVTVGLATNNVFNLFTPFGDGDVLKLCTLLAQVLHLGTVSSHQLCLEMATSQAAAAIGIQHHEIEVGNVADLVLLNVRSVSEAIGAAPMGRTVIKNGVVVAQSKVEQQWFVPKLVSLRSCCPKQEHEF
ncbi:amidohydrolase family protein [Oculatella sp. FACHB-28]|uniref:amidohydrolase family protein n=1 Tax=Oculatella sp. FACHB-28 TaxID=2692845 RepID=UPI00168339E8|nr:amidohydrolase family protein [Oculatella sp. FACHB-28]MBD2057528.1 amidohydrolase family protein [Oculatella sp. FACHB-28]